jgi:chromate transport protein ChrA
VIAFIVQMIGLLRWVFVVPVLARLFTDPAADSATRVAVSVVFTAVHQYGGVILGEHLGQSFTILWMAMISAILYRSPMFSKWFAWLGWIASAVYLLAQTELFATAISGFPVIDWAGLVGSLLCLSWMIVLGIYLFRAKSG